MGLLLLLPWLVPLVSFQLEAMEAGDATAHMVEVQQGCIGKDVACLCHFSFIMLCRSTYYTFFVLG